MSSTISIPPGIQVPQKSFSESGTISFTNKRPNTPLQPLVEVYLDSSNNIQISTVFFIDAAITGLDANSFIIFQDTSISETGEPRLQFFISYDAIETDATNFQAYQLSFQALPTIFLTKDITTIQTFLWDTDPISSRGTITNVNS
jgi:hypothetical protein